MIDPMNPLPGTTPLTRYLVTVVTFVAVLYDLVCMRLGWTTISTFIRDTDFQLGGLLRWLILGLWFHWFVGTWGTP